MDGDAVVADARPIEISVRVSGRVPDPKAADALKLLFRYQPSAPYQSRLLDQDDGGRWSTTLAANDVQDGFWYKVVGGDAETKEYRVQLTPRVTDFKTVYQFRPYLARVKETRLERQDRGGARHAGRCDGPRQSRAERGLSPVRGRQRGQVR